MSFEKSGILLRLYDKENGKYVVLIISCLLDEKKTIFPVKRRSSLLLEQLKSAGLVHRYT